MDGRVFYDDKENIFLVLRSRGVGGYDIVSVWDEYSDAVNEIRNVSMEGMDDRISLGVHAKNKHNLPKLDLMYWKKVGGICVPWIISYDSDGTLVEVKLHTKAEVVRDCAVNKMVDGRFGRERWHVNAPNPIVALRLIAKETNKKQTSDKGAK